LTICISIFGIPPESDQYLVIFGIPPESDQYLVIVILPVVASVIMQKVSQLEFIRHFFIKIQLLNIEIRLQKINLNYGYYTLPEEAKKEIDKIDQHFKEYLTDYVSSSIVVMIYLLLFATWSSGYISFVEFEIGEYNVKIFYILLVMLVINILVMFDSHDQAKQYMQDLKEIYQRYGGSDDTKR
jgi:ABC-type transport system involved in cytochrome bd biosynthesis fused ATPase/permease subunit